MADNTEMASTHIKSKKIQNISNTYSEFNTVQFDLEDKDDQHTLRNAFTTWVTDGSSIVPQSDYFYSEMYQQLPKRDKYFPDVDEQVYIDQM